MFRIGATRPRTDQGRARRAGSGQTRARTGTLVNVGCGAGSWKQSFDLFVRRY